MSIGKFIIFEGNEGTGKSTHISFAADYLKKNKIECVVTREPGGTKFGESIRDILLDSKSNLDSTSEAVLFYASRVYNYNNIPLMTNEEYAPYTKKYQKVIVNQQKINQEIMSKLEKMKVNKN